MHVNDNIRYQQSVSYNTNTTYWNTNEVQTEGAYTQHDGNYIFPASDMTDTFFPDKTPLGLTITR